MSARLVGALALLVRALAPAATCRAASEVPRVLVWGGAYGYRHPSITVGEQTMLQLAQQTGAFTATVTENPLDLSMSTLKDYDVLMWVSTTGKPPLTQQQRDDIVRWSACGGGNIGIHAALGSDYGWAEHAEIFGAQFDSRDCLHVRRRVLPLAHREGRPGHLAPAQPARSEGAAVAGREDRGRWRPAGSDRLRAPPAHRLDEDVPRRRPCLYNNMGHSESTWSVPAYQTSLVEAVKWVGGKRPKASCLGSTAALPARPGPPAPRASLVGHACAVPLLKRRSGGTWKTSGPARRLTSSDTLALGTGVAGDLAWSAQTYVLDLSRRHGRTADVTVDLSWRNPLDDYDVDVVTAWGAYGGHSGTGTTTEHMVLKDVPTCAVLHVSGDNMLATGTSGPTLHVAVSRVR